MKKIIFAFIVSILFFSCDIPAGKNYESFNSDSSEVKLPDELKGLKIYDVADKNGNFVKIAVVENKTVGIVEEHYDPALKHTVYDYTITINDDNTIIHASQILFESDSIIVLRK